MLTQLLALHKWRLSAIYEHVMGKVLPVEICSDDGEVSASGDYARDCGNVPTGGESTLKLERMMNLATLSVKLIGDSSLRYYALLAQIKTEIEACDSAINNNKLEHTCIRINRTATTMQEILQLYDDLTSEFRNLENILLEQQCADQAIGLFSGTGMLTLIW